MRGQQQNLLLMELSNAINSKEMIQTINKMVDYSEALKSSDGKFYNFGGYIFTKCDDLIEEAIYKMRVYLETNNIDYLESDLVDVIDKLLIEPTFNGFRNEQLNISLLEGMGYEIYTFPSEELKHEYDVDYSIDHMVTKRDKWYGIQSKCGSLLNTCDKEKYYNKHINAMREHPKIEDIYYIFHNVSNPSEVLSWNKRSYMPNGTRYGDILIPTYNVVALNMYNNPLIRFSDFRYLSIEEALEVWREEESNRNNDDIFK